MSMLLTLPMPPGSTMLHLGEALGLWKEFGVLQKKKVSNYSLKQDEETCDYDGEGMTSLMPQGGTQHCRKQQKRVPSVSQPFDLVVA